MGEAYEPPFTMSGEITNLIVEIGELVGSITTHEAMNPNPVLRRESKIKTIHSSLAIEHNTLTLDQVTDVIDGKRILGMIRNALSEISMTQNKKDIVKNVVTNEEKVLSLLRQDGTLTADMLAKSIGVTLRQAQRILSKLKEEGRLLRHGANKNGFWEVIE